MLLASVSRYVVPDSPVAVLLVHADQSAQHETSETAAGESAAAAGQRETLRLATT